MSCDKNHDVLQYCLFSLNKFLNLNAFNVYIGSNTENLALKNNFPIIYLLSPKSSWKYEVINQILLLKKREPELTHLLVILDDFIINKKINTHDILEYFELCELKKISYLKLKEPAFTIIAFLRKVIYKIIFRKNIIRINSRHPYYSSLQIAIWEIDHLLDLIKKSTDIWNFESIYIKSKIHYTVLDSQISYKHVIEKGKWDFGSKVYLNSVIGNFNYGNREMIVRSNLKNLITLIKKYIIFSVFGYFFVYLKKIFRN
jgi:hypothetical protein